MRGTGSEDRVGGCGERSAGLCEVLGLWTRQAGVVRDRRVVSSAARGRVVLDCGLKERQKSGVFKPDC